MKRIADLLLFSVIVFAHLVSNQASEDLCPPCYVRKANSSGCVCTSELPKGICYCHEKSKSALAYGYCMTYNNATGLVTVGKCQVTKYTVLNETGEGNYQAIDLPLTVFELEAAICEPFKRKGKLCNECVPSYGLPVVTSTPRCVPCGKNDKYYSWLLFVLFNFLPITILFVIIALFDIQLTKSPLLWFIIYSQIIIVILQYNPRTYTRLTFLTSRHFKTLLQIALTFYGVWNLDFFQFVYLPFCLGESLKETHVLMLQYLVALYPLVLITCAWICTNLYARGFKPMILVWKLTKELFKRKLCFCSKYFPQQLSPKGIANAIAAFITLAYSKILTVSACLLFPSPLYVYNTSEYGDFKYSERVLLFDSSVKSFGEEHLLYAIFAIFCLLLFVLLPLLLLLLYPIKCLRRIIPLSNRHIIHYFIEKFQGWFKDGTENGSHDFRLTSAIYPLLRIFVVVSLFLISVLYVPSASYLNGSLTWVIPGVILYGLSLFFAFAQPYKLSYMNTFDNLFFGFLAVLSLLLASEGGRYLAIFWGTVPLAVAVLYVIYRALKWIKVWYRLQKCFALFRSKLALTWKSIKVFVCCSRKYSQEREISEGLPDRFLNSDRYNRRRYTDVNNTAGLKVSLIL